MAKGKPISELRAWRKAHGLTMEQAGARIVVDGRATDKATWCGWELGKKIPKAAAMYQLERVVAIQPNAFYPRPDAGELLPIAAVPQPALSF